MKNINNTKMAQRLKYTDSLANTLAAKFNLKPSTLERWKKDGFIPGRYLSNSSFTICGMTLKECRIKSGLNQEEIIKRMAEITGFETTTVSLSGWENGSHTPGQNMINILNKTYETIFNTKE